MVREKEARVFRPVNNPVAGRRFSNPPGGIGGYDSYKMT